MGDKLRSLRKERKLSQVVVAEAVGLSRSHLAGIESGADLPGRGTLMALADYYGTSLDWLTNKVGDVIVPGVTVIQTAEEALWLGAFRELPPDEAQAHLALLLKRTNPKGS